jgi:hypothetical protein
MGKYRVNGTINDQNLVELVPTWIPNPVYGNMLYEVRHLNYRDFGPVKFPTTIHVHQGDPVFNPAHNLMEIRVTSVQANVTVPPMPVPDAVRAAAAPPVRAESQQLADGVWMVGGGSHNSVAIEFSASATTLRQTIERLKLDVAQHVPIHGHAGTHDEFMAATRPEPIVSRAARLEKERDNAALQQVPAFKAFDNVSYVASAGWARGSCRRARD